MQRDWSRANSKLTVDQQSIYTGYKAVIASMTEEQGIGSYTIYPQALTAKEFIEFLQKLRRKHGRRPLALFMDQLKVHKAVDAKPYFTSLNILPIWNVSYSPEFNPIEAVFSKVKAIFNRRRLNHLVRKLPFDTNETIKMAFSAVTRDHCVACVKKSR